MRSGKKSSGNFVFCLFVVFFLSSSFSFLLIKKIGGLKERGKERKRKENIKE